MTTLVIGGKGNMGRRYVSILKYLKEPYKIIDVDNTEKWPDYACVADRFLIATPTEVHLEQIDQLLPFNKPILCEKPLTKDVDGLEEVLKEYECPDLSMVCNFNYAYNLSHQANIFGLGNEAGNVPRLTSYDYYNSGNDGLLWDCTQLVNLAEGPIQLKNESPIWECIINGVPIDRKHIDMSYVLMIADFIGGYIVQDKDALIELHRDLEIRNARHLQSRASQYWHPGAHYE